VFPPATGWDPVRAGIACNCLLWESREVEGGSSHGSVAGESGGIRYIKELAVGTP
jgi:hypothetical protein